MTDGVSREIEVKTGRLAEMLERESLHGVLLNGRHNFAWVTGGADNGVDRSRENGAASVLVTRDSRRFLLANNIEMPRIAAEEVRPEMFEPVEFGWQDEKASATFLTEAAAKIAGGSIATDIPLNPDTRAIEPSIARCRYALVPEEIARYKVLGKDAANAFDRVAERLRPRMTELAIAAVIRSEMAAWLIEPVVTLVAVDERISRFRHPFPTRKGLGETVLLVTCAKRDGLIASLSRIVTMGPPSAELLEKTEAAAFVHANLLAATAPGTTGAELYSVARSAYARAGFAGEIENHHQGGAAGYRTRDWVAHPACGEAVQQNQAFAWNPSVTGTKVEDTVIVAGDGVEPITPTEKFPSIFHRIDGKQYRSFGVLSVSD